MSWINNGKLQPENPILYTSCGLDNFCKDNYENNNVGVVGVSFVCAQGQIVSFLCLHIDGAYSVPTSSVSAYLDPAFFHHASLG